MIAVEDRDTGTGCITAEASQAGRDISFIRRRPTPVLVGMDLWRLVAVFHDEESGYAELSQVGPMAGAGRPPNEIDRETTVRTSC